MVIDFQHHYIPVELAKKRGLYSETGRTMLQEGWLPATTMHWQLYDLDLQLENMASGRRRPIGVIMSAWVIGAARRIAALSGRAQAPILEGKPAADELRRQLRILDCTV
jgi:hypothetical protein